MPPRTSYATEDELVNFLHANLPNVLESLSWGAGASAPVQQAVYNAMRALGISDVSVMTDVRLLELQAIREVWLLVANNLAPEYDSVRAGGTDKTSQLYDHAKAQLQLSEDAIVAHHNAAEVAAGGGDDVVSITPIITVRNPGWLRAASRWGFERNL